MTESTTTVVLYDGGAAAEESFYEARTVRPQMPPKLAFCTEPDSPHFSPATRALAMRSR